MEEKFYQLLFPVSGNSMYGREWGRRIRVGWIFLEENHYSGNFLSFIKNKNWKYSPTEGF